MNFLMYRFKWKFNRFFKIPSHIDVELNNNCNQKCLSCWHSKPADLTFKRKVMPLATALDVIQSASDMGIKSIKFNLRGEPFLYPNLFTVVRYAKYRGLYTMINTNGIMIDGSDFSFFTDIDECIISVDSFNHATYCALHGCGMEDWRSLMRVLEKLHDMKIVNEIKTKIKINIHINEKNKSENFINQIKKFFMFDFEIRYTMKRHGSDIAIKKDRVRKSKCFHASRRLTVLVNGDVYPCCVCYDNPEDIRLAENFDIQSALKSEKRKSILKNPFVYNTCLNCTSADNYR